MSDLDEKRVHVHITGGIGAEVGQTADELIDRVIEVVEENGWLLTAIWTLCTDAQGTCRECNEAKRDE